MGILKEHKFSLSAGICLTGEGGKLIMVRQRRSELWGIPAGHVEQREGPIEAIFRELKEETGILPRQVKDMELQGVYTLPGENKTSVGIVMRARGIKIEGYRPEDPEIDKVDSFGVVFIEEFIRRPNWLYRPEFNRQVLSDWLKHRRGQIY